MLGIIDWGIGGISIYRRFKDGGGTKPVVYLSDTGATPYGKMTRTELVARLNSAIVFLKEHGVTHLVIGCNAASTAIPYLDDHGIKIEGMIDNAVASTAKLKPRRLAVIGGRRTILSGVYRDGFAGKRIGIEQRIAQPLSGLIESGDVSSETLRAEASRILKPIKNASHILLACTHYPAITGLLKTLVSPATIFVDPAESIVRKIERWKLDGTGSEVFMTTGDPEAMKSSAKLAFGVHLFGVKKVSF